MKTVAVTGGNGFTGYALVKQLLIEGYKVNTLARRPKEVPKHPHLQVIEGDICDTNALSRLVEGVDAVIHIAAMFRSEGPYDEFYKVNVKGTEELLRLSKEAGVRRFVYCSTIGVHGSVENSPANENTPFDPRDNYQRTKMLAEQFCMRNHGNGIEVTTIRPCSIYGPGDVRLLKMFRMIQKKIFFFVGDGSPNFHPVYIDDLVQSFILAMNEPAAAGEVFIVGGPRYLPLREFANKAANAIQAPKPFIFLPYSLMNLIAKVCEAIFIPLGLQPPLHGRRLRFFKHNRAFDISKAKKVLGYSPKIDVDEGFRRTVSWYRQKALLKPN